MRRALACVVAFVLSSASASAQVRSFPYEAVVETDGVPTHGGPGGKFYETSRLKRGTRIVVQRHDPGGWYMIVPPAGEFSLIKADAVRPAGQGTVEVTADEATVRVGSRTESRFDVEQVPLARGDRAQIVAGVTPPAGWVAIAPPRGEYRWVPGKFVVPVPDAIRSQLDADPFAVPSVAKRPEAFDESLPLAASAEPPTSSAQGPRLTLGAPELEPAGPRSELASSADAMRMLDRELEGLTLAEPTEWPLDDLASQYRRLREANPSAGRQIDVRLAQIERMRLVKEQYDEYVRLTSSTDIRDAELMAKQEGVFLGLGPQLASQGPTLAEPQLASQGPTLADPQLTLGPPMQLASDPQDTPQPLPQSAPPAEGGPQIQGGPPYATAGVANTPRPRPAQPGPLPPAAGPTLMAPGTGPVAPQSPQMLAAAPPATPPAAPRRFDAVGIVQKAVDPHPEAPQFVLVAPNGRILVYLREQPGVPLEKFVGQPMGVDGERHKHPEMTTPMIVVDRLTPVRF